MCNFNTALPRKIKVQEKKKYMKQWIEAKATAQAINMLHQIYIVEQLNVCRGYNGNGRGAKRNEKCGVSLAKISMGGLTVEYSGCYATYF